MPRDTPPPTGFVVRALSPDEYIAALPDLASLLVDVVEGGDSVSFMAGLDAATAERWWAGLVDRVADGTVTPFVARATNGDDDADAILGSVLLIRSTTPNAPHRAEIAKVLTRRSARRRGVATALMTAAEARARADGRWLLILDTVPGTTAERLYRRLGWQEVGTVPDYALTPDGVLAPTMFFRKDLR